MTTNSKQSKMQIDEALVRHLIATQIPPWKDFSIQQVIPGGWDNRTFRLGDYLLVRMPSAECYAAKVAIEHYWLPILKPLLPFSIPTPLLMGKSTQEYPCPWSVYGWLEGETVASQSNIDTCVLASDLAHFINALHAIDTTNGPVPGKHNFYRGGALKFYDAETRQALKLLKNNIDTDAATQIWEKALASSWKKPPVWVHGDISAANLLVQNGTLSAVIDFGGLAIGDPACDLVIAWTLFEDESRKLFRSQLALDAATWQRARGWALWKALIVAAEITKTNAPEGVECWRIIDSILNEKCI